MKKLSKYFGMEAAFIKASTIDMPVGSMLYDKRNVKNSTAMVITADTSWFSVKDDINIPMEINDAPIRKKPM